MDGVSLLRHYHDMKIFDECLGWQRVRFDVRLGYVGMFKEIYGIELVQELGEPVYGPA